MSKRRRASKFIVTVLVLVALTIFISRLLNSPLDDRNPSYFSSYSVSGHYKIDPVTIIGSLENEQKNVFTPLLEDPDQIASLDNKISWTQDEYLEIANALNQVVWNEPLDLEKRKVYFVLFHVGCQDNLRGFDEFTMVYYQYLGVTDWKKTYDVRIIGIYPWKGMVHWGGDTKFSDSLFFHWDHIDFANFTIPAENALQLADENGGKEVRLKVDGNCGVYVSVAQQFTELWNVRYSSAQFETRINPYTGKIDVKK